MLAETRNLHAYGVMLEIADDHERLASTNGGVDNEEDGGERRQLAAADATVRRDRARSERPNRSPKPNGFLGNALLDFVEEEVRAPHRLHSIAPVSAHTLGVGEFECRHREK